MSRKHPEQQSSKNDLPRRQTARLALIAVSSVAGVVLLLVLLSKFNGGGVQSTAAATLVSTPTVPTTPVGQALVVVEERLIGRWQRTDGDYFIEITAIDANGALAAGYYNPYPIHVAEARSLPEADVFIKLQDQNYPGSTYTLQYDPNGDTLTGLYFHAQLQQQFEVVFHRLSQ